MIPKKQIARLFPNNARTALNIFQVNSNQTNCFHDNESNRQKYLVEISSYKMKQMFRFFAAHNFTIIQCKKEENLMGVPALENPAENTTQTVNTMVAFVNISNRLNFYFFEKKNAVSQLKCWMCDSLWQQTV